uniref:Uncharacterized protein n=1 Tax=Xiphophorus couchianus TaxID=32473 RepID=A0A3B5L6P6_9TELE
PPAGDPPSPHSGRSPERPKEPGGRFVERAIKEALVYRAIDGWGTVSIIMRAVSTPQTDHRLIQLQLTSTEPEEEHIREICTHTDHGKQPNAPKLLHLLSPPPAASTWMLLHRLGTGWFGSEPQQLEVEQMVEFWFQ